MQDLEEILTLQKTAFTTQAEIYCDYSIPPLVQTLEETIAEAGKSLILKAEKDGIIVGSVRGYEDNGTCYVGKLMVLHAYRNQGIGTRLLNAIENFFPGCRYELFTGYLSVDNLRLYESLGYRRFKEEAAGPNMVLVYMEKHAGGARSAVMQPDKQYIMAIDQGTTGTTVLIVDENGDIISRSYGEITQIYPQPGWVEHAPEEIWAVSCNAAKDALTRAGIDGTRIRGIGITNQRETTVVWEKESGRPVCNAIVWQCRRSAALCDFMKAEGMESRVREKTGLVIDAYFSATKLAWILDTIPGAREKAHRGELLFGTIDSYLVWKLTGGKVHITDYSNASRTMLYNIHSLDWDPELLNYLDIPRSMLPEVRGSSEVYGYTLPEFFGGSVAIAGIAGDQQAALFGQTCFTPGNVKSTYGTGCFLLMNTGTTPIHSNHGLLTTIAWGVGGKVTYALEGSVFIAGAAVQWLRDQLRIISTAAETEELAASLCDNGGVYMVPAFVGLGAPHWDMYTRGTIVGLTGGTGRAHLARAVLESIAYQTGDILELMSRDARISLDSLNVDGGASANNFLMQFQSDILDVRVERPRVTESTALGAAFLAGLATGYWVDCEQLNNIRKVERSFTPGLGYQTRTRLLSGWQRAIDCARSNPVHD